MQTGGCHNEQMYNGEVAKTEEWSSACTVERGRMGDGCETGLWSTVDQVIHQCGQSGGAQQHTDIDSVPEHLVWMITEAQMRNSLLSGLEFLEGLPWFMILLRTM